MSDSFFEVVQLENGEIAIKRTDDSGRALVTICFSDEVKAYLGDSVKDVGRAMISAGVESASKATDLEDGFGSRSRVIH